MIKILFDSVRNHNKTKNNKIQNATKNKTFHSFSAVFQKNSLLVIACFEYANRYFKTFFIYFMHVYFNKISHLHKNVS